MQKNYEKPSVILEEIIDRKMVYAGWESPDQIVGAPACTFTS
ncbi:MAG TPA: hypothetical protein PLD55_15540 [bacterium]|nr:hypothetical protein [bacterium]